MAEHAHQHLDAATDRLATAPSQEPVDRDLFRLYVGPNAETFQKTLDKIEAAEPKHRQAVMSWSWPAFLVSLPWLMYRKQWMWAGVVLILPTILNYLFGYLSTALIATTVGMQGKSNYVIAALERIRKISSAETDPVRRRHRVARAGGVSVAGAILGTVILVMSWTAPYLIHLAHTKGFAQSGDHNAGASAIASSFPERLAALLISIGPALPIGVILLALGARTIAPRLASAACVLGVLASVSSLAASIPFMFATGTLKDPVIKAAAQAFLDAAVSEEAAKLIVLSTVVLRHEDALRARDAVLAGAWLGLGFAVFENFFYVTGDKSWFSTATIRAATAVPTHVALGMVMGFFVMQTRRGAVFLAFAVPAALHGFYDWPALLFGDRIPAPHPWTAAWIGILVAALVALWVILHGPIANAILASRSAPAAEDAIGESIARRMVAFAGVTAILCWLCSGLILLGVALAAGFLDFRYAALSVLAVMPAAFANLWRRARAAVIY
jgi:RsiW-degrading membrane proteinase PrsW (M82 family)